ncbi:hypothetical protein UAW_01553 [Enterococcus haemoperoxidus ATCC BAA-382]|uniref:Uncharacterized protein n=1 Tax=Enterococcus haemoperoxidus ATCC BAA-382 TaxID=1158608 RepID=R2QPB1_9ENTE|nr:hypothetical protein [Enterococcus haemoperoxidus]EOH98372.1 hypothetical protein UAW_01553 [Enterococcus haemoperoxidus ATCC BAA-382]EOT59885.1 hypothetical protein I583_02520 [Enterococcus haemoperoxidus ATCC BAA-382]OJG56064.1 hypothetical protein RV06_GL000180 [Enterococcus haemoperoxidus]
MENLFSSKDQVLLFLVIFSLLLLLFAILVDKSNGLFLARNLLDIKSYEISPENKMERQAGKLFVRWVYYGVSVMVPGIVVLYLKIWQSCLLWESVYIENI